MTVDIAAIPRGYILDQPDWDKNVDLFYTRIDGFKRKFIDAVRNFVDEIDAGAKLNETILEKSMKSFIWHAKRLVHSKATFDEKHFHRPIMVNNKSHAIGPEKKGIDVLKNANERTCI